MNKTYDYTKLAVRRALTAGDVFGRRQSRSLVGAKIGAALAGLGMLLGANTYNYKGGVLNGSAAGQVATPGLFSVVDVKLDFAAIAAERTAAGAAALVATDTLELIPVNAGEWIVAAFIDIDTAEGAACTVDLGDGDDPNGYIATGDINATTPLSSLVTVGYSVATAGGRRYAAADTVDLLLNSNGTDTAVIHVKAVAVDLRSYR